MRPRVGHINFLNCFPIYYGLEKSGAFLEMDMIPGTPAELNSGLVEEKLDISPISSIEYFRHKSKFLIFPDITVSSSGSVGSVILFSKVPIQKLAGAKIALSSFSATSHVLLRVILKNRYGIDARFVTGEPDLDMMLSDSDAALLIGDNALEEGLNGHGLHKYDLGQEWQRLCGEKMVYALWCVRKKYAKEHPETARKVLNYLRESSSYSQNNLKEVITKASKWKRFPSPFIEKYLSDLDYNLDLSAQTGLLAFSEMAKESGYIKQNGKLEFFV